MEKIDATKLFGGDTVHYLNGEFISEEYRKGQVIARVKDRRYESIIRELLILMDTDIPLDEFLYLQQLLGNWVYYSP